MIAALLTAVVVILLPNLNYSQIPDPTPSECFKHTVSEQDITEFIFKKYSGKDERPRLNAMHTVNLNLTLRISSINDVLEKERVMRVTAYLALRWFDEFHVWNESFPQLCIPYIVLEQNRLWLPDVAQINDRAGRYTLMEMPGEKIRLHSNGFTTYSPGGTFDAYCDFDFTIFPFDSQTCGIQLESWRYTSSYVSFHIGSPTKVYQWWENDQWTLTGTGERLFGETYTFTEMKFDRVEFYIYLKRKSTHYVLNIVCPSLIIALAQISVFTLPLHEPAKLEVSFTCLLAYSVYQLMISTEMPRSSDRVPLLTIYIGLKMFYLAVCMLGEGCVFMMLNCGEENYDNVPRWLYRTVLIGGRILMVGRSFRDESNGGRFKGKRIAAPKKPSSADTSKDSSNKQQLEIKIDKTQKLALSIESSTDTEAEDESETAPGRSISSPSTWKKCANPIEFNRRNKWLYAAKVADRATCTFYIIGIFVTPLVMFIIGALHVRWLQKLVSS